MIFRSRSHVVDETGTPDCRISSGRKQGNSPGSRNELPIAKLYRQCHPPQVVAKPPLKINLIARTNGVGLDRDVDLIAEILESKGHQITRSHCRDIPFWNRWIPKTPSFDLNLFMERIFPAWISSAAVNGLIPNQERFPERHLKRLQNIDHILCKSAHALEVFSPHHSSCHLTGFTSTDLHQDHSQETPPTFLHLAGRSTLKGTETILALWEKHPEWPPLLLIQHKDNAPESVPANVTLRSDYLSSDELRSLMNEKLVHLCPSLSEGWGHYIVEAMSCEAVVITTDGPPMNELVGPDRGYLAKVATTGPRHLGTNFRVDPGDLEQLISQILQNSPEELETLGRNARAWFQTNDKHFRESFPALIEDLIA